MPKFKSYIGFQLTYKVIMALFLFSSIHTVVAITKKPTVVQVFSFSNRTRVVLKSDHFLKYKQFFLKNPTRIVVDLEGIDLSVILKRTEKKNRKSDPCILSIRIGRFDSKTMRIVLRLKKNVEPRLFSLSPISNGKKCLLIDLYSTNFINIRDPFLALLKDCGKNDPKRKTISKKNTLQSVRKRPVVIMLDPGHGGVDFGAVGKCRTREKDIVLQIARRLKKLIDNENNMCAFMTRNKDVFLPIKARVDKAKKHHSDLFVSIHANSFTNPKPLGSSVFAFSTKKTTSIATKCLAKIQNSPNFIRGVNKSKDCYVDNTMFDTAQSLTIVDSIAFGNAVLNRIAKINKLHKNNVEQAGFAVLKSPDIPSILVETAFISNEEEERKLRTEKFQKEIAESIFSGIKAYLKKK